MYTFKTITIIIILFVTLYLELKISPKSCITQTFEKNLKIQPESPQKWKCFGNSKILLSTICASFLEQKVGFK